MNSSTPIGVLSAEHDTGWQATAPQDTAQSTELARSEIARAAVAQAQSEQDAWALEPRLPLWRRAPPALPWIGRKPLVTQVLAFGGTGLFLLLCAALLLPWAAGSTALLAIGLVAFLLGFSCILALAYACVVEARRQALHSESENRRNQAAIMRLLNEMGDLAEGDLTVRAQVTEDVTGAIADSMNFAVEELRNLVVGIDRGAQRLADKSATAYRMSGQMMLAAQRQSQGIHDAGHEVTHLLGSIRTVSSAAADAASVARGALSAAAKGEGAANDTIRGMVEIRTQIQDTSKRIKRLGERSQEIGEIVELIADISEQTNLLALNAAIRAAAATERAEAGSEAGRGFSLVAEEIQQLAERSAEATRAVSGLVKSIQDDTIDAMVAMERSTAEVVEGARRADAAGQALDEIRQVTRQQAALIEAISRATESQVAVTGQISHHMEEVLQLTEVVQEGATQTAGTIGDLNALAEDLRGSISGFQL
jgi:twitching motility protein PilJ